MPRGPVLLRLALFAALVMLGLAIAGLWMVSRHAAAPGRGSPHAMDRPAPIAPEFRPRRHHDGAAVREGADTHDEDDYTGDVPIHAVIPLRVALQKVGDRYRGRVISAELVRPTRREFAQGVQLVYALRMLTPEQDVLLIRVDAHDADVLDVAGNDLVRARRRPHGE